MRAFLICFGALLGLAACASSGSTTSGAAASGASGSGATSSPRVRTQTMGISTVGNLALTTVVDADVVSLPYDAEAMFRILPSVYDSLGIQVTALDPARKQIGNSGFKIRNRLGKTPLSYYLDCGNAQIGPNADSYDVVLSVTSTVSAGGAGQSSLSTLVEAQARPATYNQAYTRCSTKGALEQKLVDLVNRRLTK
jgi:hypothetical protein